MNSELIKRTRRLAAALTVAAAAAGLGSCESIYDYEGDCDPHWQVKFIYDMNMNFADAFPGPMGVGSVHLYVFDAATHRLVLEKAETAGAEGFAEGYTMPVEELPVGHYDFVAWCGVADNRSFVGEGAAPAWTAPERYDGTAQAWRLSEAVFDAPDADAARRLDPLYYGRTGNFEIYDRQGTHIVPVHLTKDTNEFTLKFQHRSKPLNPADFIVRIVDDNTALRWDNALVPGTPETNYLSWEVRQGTVEETKPVLGAEPVENNLLVVRISMSRLIQGREHRPRLEVIDKTRAAEGSDGIIFDFDLLPYLLKAKPSVMDAHNNPVPLPDPEYLDREDSWDMHFILDDKLSEQGGWYALELHILAWHKVFNDDTELH